MKRWLGIALVTTLLVGPIAAREAAAGAPTEQLRTQVDKVLKILDDNTLKSPDKAKERRTAVRKVADDIFDFGEKIQYVGDKIDGETAVVSSKLLTKAGGEVPIEYRMLKKGERWLVYDVVIEGVSLVANYRTQFNKIIQTSSFEDLVKKMKTRQEELGSAASLPVG